jgi:hypothetical protein
MRSGIKSMWCSWLSTHRVWAGSTGREKERVEARLNWVMMRSLDLSLYTRVTAREVHLMLPVLEPVVKHLLVSGHEDLLDQFDQLEELVAD